MPNCNSTLEMDWIIPLIKPNTFNKDVAVMSLKDFTTLLQKDE